MGLSPLRLKLNYEFAEIDRRAFVQLTVCCLVGTILFILLGFRFEDLWGSGIFAVLFLGLAIFTGYLAKRSHDAMKYWKQQYELSEIIK